MEKQAKINRMPTPLVNQHSITSTALKVERQMVHDFFSSLFSCGAHSARNGQGHTSELRVPGCAACSGMWVFIYGCVFCAFGLGLWQMLDADGWCLLMVLYMVLSDILADRYMARRQQVRWKGCFTLTYFYWDFSGLLQVGLFLVAVHVIFPFVVCIWERAGNLKQEDDKGAERLHP